MPQIAIRENIAWLDKQLEWRHYDLLQADKLALGKPAFERSRPSCSSDWGLANLDTLLQQQWETENCNPVCSANKHGLTLFLQPVVMNFFRRNQCEALGEGYLKLGSLSLRCGIGDSLALTWGAILHLSGKLSQKYLRCQSLRWQGPWLAVGQRFPN